MRFFIHTILTMFLFSNSISIASENIPNLVGTWVGINKTVSEDRGYRSWEKKVEILEQDERRFKGKFSYTDGTKNFFGVIHPDNKTITWVALIVEVIIWVKLLDQNKISACYVESGIDATAGCAELTRK